MHVTSAISQINYECFLTDKYLINVIEIQIFQTTGYVILFLYIHLFYYSLKSSVIAASTLVITGMMSNLIFHSKILNHNYILFLLFNFIHLSGIS